MSKEQQPLILANLYLFEIHLDHIKDSMLTNHKKCILLFFFKNMVPSLSMSDPIDSITGIN
jgi:hypothetical protein